jgi:hypothetical protein
VSVIGGSVGPSQNYIAVPNDDASRPSRHILVDGVRFDDVSRDPGEHVECLMLADGDGVVIRTEPTRPPVDGYYSVFFADDVTTAGLPWSDFVLSGNRCGQGWTFGSCARRRFVVRSNAGC